MITYEIAGLTVAVKCRGKTLLSRGARYRTENSAPTDITIDISNEFLEKKQLENSNLSFDDCEYIWTGTEFYRSLLNFDGFMLHASAVMLDGAAYLFSAPCGTGKSTHTALWQKHFGEDRAEILNDDKPAILFRGGQFFASGTPWSGKTDQSLNCMVPLQGITFLEQSKTNTLKKISGAVALGRILNQTLRPATPERMDRLLSLLDALLTQIPVFVAGVDMSDEAVLMTFNSMSGNTCVK